MIRKTYKLAQPVEHAGHTIARVALLRPTHSRLLAAQRRQLDFAAEQGRAPDPAEIAQIVLATMTDLPEGAVHSISIPDATALLRRISKKAGKRQWLP